MEDTLREFLDEHRGQPYGVLILVLMEDTLRVLAKTLDGRKISLNPCFNGRYSQSSMNIVVNLMDWS